MKKQKKLEQHKFFEIPQDFEQEWQDMPEFIIKELPPYKSIMVHFLSEKDVKKFSELINQNITNKTIYLWYPKPKARQLTRYKYVDEFEYRKRKLLRKKIEIEKKEGEYK